MTRLFMGRMADGYPALRIMKNDTDDPLTSSPINYAKYIFDSRSTNLNYIADIFARSYDPAYPLVDFPGKYYYEPAGSDGTNCEIAIHSQQSNNVGTWQNWYYFKEFFERYGDSMGIMEVRAPGGDDLNEFRGPGGSFYLPHTGWPDSGLFGSASSDNGYIHKLVQGAGGGRLSTTVELTKFNRPLMVSVIDLPSHNDPIPNQGVSPVPGQKVVYISKSEVSVALPGFDADSSDFRKFIVHKDRVPAKIMKAGDIPLPINGTATINTPLPLTLLTYMDFHVRTTTNYQQSDKFHMPPFFGSPQSQYMIKFSYKVLPQSVELVNRCNYNLVIRYMICADDDADYTTGGSKVFYKGNDGTQDFIQFKRPGSSDTDYNLNDIILDSRLSYVPILKEGFLRWPQDFPQNGPQVEGHRVLGEKMGTVTFDNPDNLLPMVKHLICFPRNKPYGQAFISAITSRDVFVNSGNNWSGRTNCFNATARIDSDTSVSFIMSGSNPMNVSSGGQSPNYPPYAAEGIRYYIFGIQPTD